MSWISELDDLLRGRLTDAGCLAEGRIRLSLRRYAVVAILLGAVYGFFMGWFGLANRTPANYMQIVASMVKIPALFLLTLVVTMPSLYVFSALLGCRLSLGSTVRLLLACVVVTLAVAASFGTILGFFTLSTASYSFMVLLNVILLGIAGLVGLGFLLQALQRLAKLSEPEQVVNSLGPDTRISALAITAIDKHGILGSANNIFHIWLVINALVGVQMAWLLRPFVGDPSLPFEWFRPRSGNFFLAISKTIESLTH